MRDYRTTGPARSASHFLNEQDYAKLFAEKHTECMEKAANTDGAERTTWLNRAAYYASTGANPTMARAEGSSYARASARRDECFAAIDAMTAEIERLRTAMAARDVAAAENCTAATAMRLERDRYRAALEEIRDRAPGMARTVARGETPASALARMAAIAVRALDRE